MTLQLSNLILDEPPQFDFNDATMCISMVRRLLEVHDNALALAGTAHLARLKAYSSKFLSLVSQRFPPETGLRPPSILEAQQADKHLWSCIYQLVIEKSWKLNDAIYEYTEIRGDMASWLQPRAKVASALPRRPHGPGGKDHRTPIATSGRGSGKGKGKPRGSSKGTQKGSWPGQEDVHCVAAGKMSTRELLRVHPWLYLPEIRWVSMPQQGPRRCATCGQVPLKNGVSRAATCCHF